MGARIVVGFLTRVEAGSPGEAHVKRVTDLCKKAEALGGQPCAFGSRSVAFDFADDELEEAIVLALGERADVDEPPASAVSWRVGIAEGEMIPVGQTGPLARLGWGEPLVTAIALARIARPGEVLVDPRLGAVTRGEVLTSGSRTGKDAARGVQGLIVDPRQALRQVDGPKVTELARPNLVGQGGALRELLSSRAPLAVIRALPGLGGTRLLTEVGAALSPARSLYLCGAGAEPLGALRRAFARSMAAGGPLPSDALPQPCSRGLERLLQGEGIDIRLGAELVAHWVTSFRAPDGTRPRGAVLVDDAMDVDDPSLDVVAKVVEFDPGALFVVARLDKATPLPPPFQSLACGPIVNLAPLPRSNGEELAASAARGTLSTDAARRWARRGRFVPLGIFEALAEALSTGELEGSDAVPSSRGGATELHTHLEPKDWIGRRLRYLPPAAKDVLRAVAVLGVEGVLPLVVELSKNAGIANPSDHAARLVREGWLSAAPEGFYVLPSRTHRDVLLSDIPDSERAKWHDAASRAIERLGGKLASAEAARHAALAGDQARAVELAMVAAKASRHLELEAATEALLAFAGASADDIDPMPATSSDFRLVSWIDGLRASGDRDGAVARLRAIASLTKGETSEALAALRAGVDQVEGAHAAARSRASLAYGIGLAVAGNQTEALFSALEALARAREGGDLRGARACARFLARLTLAAGHREASRAWQRMAAEAG